MSDKRKVSTDALETLGTKIGPDEKRDAIHLAVIPVKAKFTLSAGDHVNSKGEPFMPYVGIVDPFLTQEIKPGEHFWLVIYPRQITSLRHVWSHPSFPEEKGEPMKLDYTPEASEKWLRNWVRNSECPSYEFLLEIGRTGYIATNADDDDCGGRADEEYLTVYGSDASGEIPGEVWDHVENVIGRPVTQRPQWFSCAC